MRLELAASVPVTTAEGPFDRFAIWLQGCSLRCPGCCNPELFDRGRAGEVEVDALIAAIDRAARERGVEGLSVLGGEPLDQLDPLTELCEAVQARGLGVVVFTGYARAEAQARFRAGFARLWAAIDTLIDGRFVGSDREPAPERGGRRFVGSRNQVIHHRSDRYADPSLWTGPPALELRLPPSGAPTLHGDPGLARTLTRLLRDPGLRGA